MEEANLKEAFSKLKLCYENNEVPTLNVPIVIRCFVLAQLLEDYDLIFAYHNAYCMGLFHLSIQCRPTIL